MNRRDFIVGGVVAVWPREAIPQQSARLRLVGVLMAVAADQEGQSRAVAFRKALQEIGWMEGKDLQIIDRWTAGEARLRREYAAELVGLAPDVILVNGLLPLKALLEQTRSIPIVFVQVSDPIGSGFVPNTARPGGHITGFTHFESATAGKWLEILRELAPNVRRVAVMCAPQDPAFPGFLRAIEGAAHLHGVQVIPSGVSDASEVESNLNELARETNGGIVVLPSPPTTVHRQRIIAVAARHRLPAIYPWRFFASDGGLVSYGIDNVDLYRRAATYVDRILKGASAGDLPVQSPIKFEFVINLKTAKALGLTVPPTLLARADEVIE